MHEKAKKLSKAMVSKGKKKTSAYEKRMGHGVASAAHKRMVGKKSGY